MAMSSSDDFDRWGYSRPTNSPRSPWQNGYAERLIGSIRRECLDHVVVFGERHLRHILLSYLPSGAEKRRSGRDVQKSTFARFLGLIDFRLLQQYLPTADMSSDYRLWNALVCEPRGPGTRP